MNKLEVAIKLIQLLNERRTITSKVISDEFNVSLRTAQRYIRELSALPCFVSTEKNNCYELYPNYKLKEALLNTNACEIMVKNMQNESSRLGDVMCLFCGLSRGKVAQSLFIVNGDDIRDAHKFEQLMEHIRKTLKEKMCSFPESNAE